MNRKWTEKEIWEWYNARPWITGCNYIPSVAINGIEFWQEYRHGEIFREVGKEISLAASIGFNSFRLVFPFVIWQHNREIFFRHIDEFFDLCSHHNITVMPVLFGDCCVPKNKYKPGHLGPQPEPIPGYFGGSVLTPFDGTSEIGWNPTDESEMKPIMEEYIRSLAKKYGKDNRIIIWNIWNEAGNSNRETRSQKDIENIFTWFREEDVDQPLTADIWCGGIDNPDGYLSKPGIYTEIEKYVANLSDIITFHYYGDYIHTRKFIEILRGYGRPIINDEWLHRPMRSLIQTHLPLFKRENVGSYMFGFVNGKTQHNFVWEFLKNRKDMDVDLWMHDIFYDNFLPYDEEEIRVIKETNFGIQSQHIQAF
jgi:hypothetical protein